MPDEYAHRGSVDAEGVEAVPGRLPERRSRTTMRPMRRVGMVSALAVAWTLVRAAWAWPAASPSPTARGSSGGGGFGAGSVLSLLIFAGLVLLLVYYRRRVLEPFTRRYSNPDADRPRDEREQGEDRPTS